MYLNTNRNLLKPIHSLLAKPFDFSAQHSMQKLKNNMEYFYEDLEILARIYDTEKDKIRPKLSEICHKSESCYKCGLSEYISDICNNHNLLDAHSVQVQIERLYDHFKLKSEGNYIVDLNDYEYMSVLNFLRMNELLALCIAGKVKVRIFNKKIIFSPSDSSSRKELYATWFSRFIESSSNLSTLNNFIRFSTCLEGRVNDEFIDFFLDKVFSIKFTDIPKKGKELQCVERLVDTIKLVLCVIYECRLNKSNYISINELVRRSGLEKEEIEFIVKLQNKQLVSEKFLLEKNDYLSVKIITFIKNIRSFFNELAKFFNETSERECLIGGKLFEINSIKNRILNSDYKRRYSVFDGINRGDVKIENELDIEYIIYDKDEEWYYFIQSKYSVFGERSYFEGEIKQIQSDIEKGLTQLRSAKDLFEKGKLETHLNKIGVEKATSNNSSFVLLHNIPQLDFQMTIDRIALYDWNTFKNLLKNGECIVSDGMSCRVYNLGKNIIMNEPQKVLDTLLSEHKEYSVVKNNIDVNHQIVNRFIIGDKEIVVVGLGL